LLHLSNNGLVVRKRGAGTLVAEEKINRSVELTSLHDDLVAAGRAPTTTVLRNGVTHASERVASDAADVCQERRDRRGTRLDEARGAALLTMERISYGENGGAVEFAQH